jgi:hypothetical protein
MPAPPFLNLEQRFVSGQQAIPNDGYFTSRYQTDGCLSEVWLD